MPPRQTKEKPMPNQEQSRDASSRKDAGDPSAKKVG